MSAQLDEIKKGIETLPPEETFELKRWLLERMDTWDRQMIEDIDAGRFQPLFEQLDAELAAGNFTEDFKRP